MKSTNVCIFKLEKNLDDINSLLNKCYYSEIAELSDQNLTREEKNYVHKWCKIHDTKVLDINGTELKYIETSASIEVPSMKKSDINLLKETGSLKKNLIVDKRKSYVLFTQYLGAFYAIICGSKGLEGKIRSNLMETKLKKDSCWGEINFKSINEYTFEKGFYYWLLDVRGTTLTIDNKNIVIKDVKGFKSNTEKNTCSFNGQGNNIYNRLPLMSVIGKNERITSLYINILYNNIEYSFYLDYNGRLDIFESECGQFNTQTPKIIKIKDILFTIYFEILPYLKKKYNKAISNGWYEDELTFRKKMSTDIINELIRFNSLKIEDLEIAIEK